MDSSRKGILVLFKLMPFTPSTFLAQWAILEKSFVRFINVLV